MSDQQTKWKVGMKATLPNDSRVFDIIAVCPALGTAKLYDPKSKIDFQVALSILTNTQTIPREAPVTVWLWFRDLQDGDSVPEISKHSPTTCEAEPHTIFPGCLSNAEMWTKKIQVVQLSTNGVTGLMVTATDAGGGWLYLSDDGDFGGHSRSHNFGDDEYAARLAATAACRREAR